MRIGYARVSANQWLDLTTPLGKGILAFLSALAEDERARILARAIGGRAAAKKRGVSSVPSPNLLLIRTGRWLAWSTWRASASVPSPITITSVIRPSCGLCYGAALLRNPWKI